MASLFAAGAATGAATATSTATTAMTAATMAAMALSTGVGIIGSIRQGETQRAQAEAQSAQYKQQAEIAKTNQKMAQDQASAERKSAYDQSVKKKQEAAILIGQQRAISGASGAAVDTGSNLDIQIDTAERGAADATNIYNAGMDKAYNYEVQAWNYGRQAAGYSYNASLASSTASSYPTTTWLNAASTGLGGIANIGSTWMKFNTMNKTKI